MPYKCKVKKQIVELQSSDITRKYPKNRFKRAAREAKRRHLPWELTYEQYASLIALPCVYCGQYKHEDGTGLDRINNNRGYCPDNVQPACYVCNMMRGVFPADFFRACAKRVK